MFLMQITATTVPKPCAVMKKLKDYCQLFKKVKIPSTIPVAPAS